MSPSQRKPWEEKGYDHVQGEDAQAADEPGQVVQDIVSFTLPWLGVLQQHAGTVQQVPQHHQGKEGVGDASGGFPLVLEGEAMLHGDGEKSLGAAPKSPNRSGINHPPLGREKKGAEALPFSSPFACK